MADELTSAAANGDEKLVESLIQRGAEVNAHSREGFIPLCIAAFWGYSGIVKVLLDHRADVNACNKGTLWSALHCAAFQGHGKVIMMLMDHRPNLTLKDSRGRTAADFASAVEPIWPFFAAAGCKRTPKSGLIKMDIVKKITQGEERQPTAVDQQTYFSRPGSAYVVKSQSLYGERKLSGKQRQEIIAASTGDVLTDSEPIEVERTDRGSPSFSVWRS